MSSGRRVSRFLPSDPQFLLEYIDAAPSDESDSELDWYDDEQDESNDDNEHLDDTSIDAAPASSHTRVCNNLPSTSTSVQSLTSSSQNFPTTSPTVLPTMATSVQPSTTVGLQPIPTSTS